MHHGFLVSVWCVGAACSSPLSRDDFCKQLQPARCDFLKRCGHADPEADCEAILRFQSWSGVDELRTCPPLLDGLEEHDEAGARECLERLRTAACLERLPYCHHSRSLKQLGDDCDVMGCGPDLVCRLGVNGCTGSCVDACGAPTPVTNAACSPITRGGGIGASCANEAPCGPGLSCRGGTCTQTLLGVGAECLANLACASGYCHPIDAGVRVCRSGAFRDEACRVDATGEGLNCVRGLDCVQSRCVPGKAPVFLELGSPCTPMTIGECDDLADCAPHAPDGGWICVERPARGTTSGAPCTARSCAWPLECRYASADGGSVTTMGTCRHPSCQ